LKVKQGAQIENVKDLTDIAEDLMDPTISQYPAEWGQGPVASILDSLPNKTQYLVMHKKFIINPPSGIPLNNYKRCHVQGGQVQIWMTKCSN
jgi:hypothetical protein